jgi:hypothetical protein
MNIEVNEVRKVANNLLFQIMVRIFGGCAGGKAQSFRDARSLRQLPCFLVLAAQLPNIFTLLTVSVSELLRTVRGMRATVYYPLIHAMDRQRMLSMRFRNERMR